jgi:glycosyltransferase involved in cell wall biosynthesis
MVNRIAREIIARTAERFAADPRPVILILLHDLGGGTEKHVRSVAGMLHDQAIFLMVKLQVGRKFGLGVLNDENSIVFKSSDWNEMRSVLQLFDLKRIHVHHAYGFLDQVQCMLEQLKVPYDLTIHDFMLICPRLFLYREGIGFCGEPAVAGCQQCLRERPTPLSQDILWWRWLGRELIERAERVICPSRDAAGRIQRYAPRAKLLVVPHEDPSIFTPRRVRIPPLSSEDRMRVAVLGIVTEHKGPRFLLDCLFACKAAKLGLDVTLIGELRLTGVEELHLTGIEKLLRVTGRYEAAKLPQLIATVDPHLIFYSQKSPETYSYTLSEGLQAGVPLVMPDLGAFRERTEGLEWCWLYDPSDSPAMVAELLRRVRIEHLEKNVPPVVFGCSARVSRWDFYQNDYLLPALSRTLTVSQLSCRD